MKEELSNIVKKSESIIEDLELVGYDGFETSLYELKRILKEFSEGSTELITESKTLKIGIVGQVKAGKSTFLNSMFFNGKDILPKASTPMTAGLTVIEYSDDNVVEIEYYNSKDWKIFEDLDKRYKEKENEIRSQNPGAKENIIERLVRDSIPDTIKSAHELVVECHSDAKAKIGSDPDPKKFNSIDDIQNILESYVGAKGKYTSVVKSLHIKLKDDRLKGLCIVDTPGVNDPVVSRENRTREFLSTCHGVFMLSSSNEFMGSNDISFLNNRIGSTGIEAVVLLASKFDSVLQDIGAEREMKHEEKGDLVETAEMQTKRIKRRYRELESDIKEELQSIRIDTTAGIGYSIAHKKPGKWDNVEKQVVQQMKRYYPDYFSTENDTIQTFDELSNISEIKDKYLDKYFVENKDSIIEKKVSEYFKKQNAEIVESLNKMITFCKNRQDELNKVTIEETKNQLEIQKKMFVKVSNEFLNHFQTFIIGLQSKIKNVHNKLYLAIPTTIPTETRNEERAAGWLGWRTETVQVEIIDAYKLQTQIELELIEYLNKWNDNWKNLFKDNQTILSEKLTDVISDFEKKVMTSKFDNYYYRNLIDRTLLEFRNLEEIDVHHRLDDFKSGLREIVNSIKNTSDNISEEIKVLKDDIDNFRKNVEYETKCAIENNMKKAIAEIEKMKRNFTDKLVDEGKNYLNNLENDLKQSNFVVNKIETIIEKLTELKQLYS